MSYEAWGEPDESPFEAAIEAGWIDPTGLSKAVIDVMNERDRQWNEEGWTPEHDDQHCNGELAIAAGWYALNAPYVGKADCIGSPAALDHEAHDLFAGQNRAMRWPWAFSWWKPKDPRRDLVRAAALIIAEIERLDRAEARKAVTP